MLSILKTAPGQPPMFEALKDDAKFWYRRGFEINKTVMSDGRIGLSRLERLKTKASRALILHAALLAGRQMTVPVEDQMLRTRSRSRSTIASLIGDEATAQVCVLPPSPLLPYPSISFHGRC